MLVADQVALMAASWQAVRGASRWGGMTKCGGGADGAKDFHPLGKVQVSLS